jgi:hypothetical protein
MADCAICRRPITPWHQVVRVVAELARRGAGDPHSDSTGWTVIDDWDTAALMHAECVARSLGAGFAVPYASAVSRLILDHEPADGVRAALGIIDGEAG